MSKFRLVALCNVVVKIVTKVFANTLKCLMLKLASENQRSFIHGHQATVNIILTQEIIHSMRQKKGAKATW